MRQEPPRAFPYHQQRLQRMLVVSLGIGLASLVLFPTDSVALLQLSPRSQRICFSNAINQGSLRNSFRKGRGYRNREGSSCKAFVDENENDSVQSFSLSNTTSENDDTMLDNLVPETTVNPLAATNSQDNITGVTSNNDNGKPTDFLAWLDEPSAAIWLLNAVAVIWGTQHAVIKTVVSDNAPVFTLVRFALAALLASPYTPGLAEFWSNDATSIVSNEANVSSDATVTTDNTGAMTSTLTSTSTLWRWGAELGLWMFLGFAFQAIGLQFTTAQKSGFLLYLNVKFVPLLALLLYGRSIPVISWISALTAFAGTALLATGGGSLFSGTANVAATSAWNVGDAWSMAAAVASAMFILRLERASLAVPSTQASQLNSACLWIVTALSLAWTIFLEANPMNAASSAVPLMTAIRDMIRDSWPAFLYLSGIATAVCNFLQTKAQRNVRAERATVVYAMDPVYGALFSAWWLGESLPGVPGYVGAGLITAAAATNAFFETKGNDDSDEENALD